jgi:enamine deaminase RidA (YjgF/YER057c/UK114 family)
MKNYSILLFVAVALFSCTPSQKEPAKEGAAATAANTDTSSVDVEQKIKDMGIVLKTPAPPTANFVKAVRTGNLVYIAGHGPEKLDGSGMVIGKVGSDLTMEQGAEAARLTGIAILSTLKAEIGDLNKVKRIVKVLGMVNSDPSFKDQPKVINGFSDLMVEIFGAKGKHARSAVGMVALPNNMTTEVEMIVEVEDK